MQIRDMRSYKAELEIVSGLLDAAKGVEAGILNELADVLQQLCDLYQEIYPTYYKNGILDKVAYERLEASLSTDKISTRLQKMIDRLEYIVENLQITEMGNWFFIEYNWVANQTAKSLRSYRNPQPRSTALNKKEIKEEIRKPWCEDHRDYLSRIKRNSVDMRDKISFVMLQGLRNGWDVNKMSDKFRTIVGIAASKATRLLRTESMAVYSKATKEVFLNNGVQYVSIIGDAECGTICTEYVDEMIPLETARLGLELPPYHPNCACCYCANGAFGDTGDLGYVVD